MTRPTQFRDPDLETSGDVVGFYEREFYPFSNFSSFQVLYKNYLWPTSEHAYQAEHFYETAPELVTQIKQATSAHDAYKIAKAHAHLSPKNWHSIKRGIMLDICKTKLDQHPYIQHKLADTGDLVMVEDSPRDSFWGWGHNKAGKNELGKIWMELRSTIK